MNSRLQQSSNLLRYGGSERERGTLPQLVEGVDERVGQLGQGREVEEGVRGREGWRGGGGKGEGRR